LSEAADLMILRIVDPNIATGFNRQATGSGKVGVGNVVL